MKMKPLFKGLDTETQSTKGLEGSKFREPCGCS
jgi:hypothetical protein